VTSAVTGTRSLRRGQCGLAAGSALTRHLT
jgi:hypothetical protein